MIDLGIRFVLFCILRPIDLAILLIDIACLGVDLVFLGLDKLLALLDRGLVLLWFVCCLIGAAFLKKFGRRKTQPANQA